MQEIGLFRIVSVLMRVCLVYRIKIYVHSVRRMSIMSWRRIYVVWIKRIVLNWIVNIKIYVKNVNKKFINFAMNVL